MRRPVALLVAGLAFCGAGLLLAGCVPGEPVAQSTMPAKPIEVRPLKPLTEAAVLAYCPDLRAEHFDGFRSYAAVYICRSDDRRPSDGTTTYGPWQSVYRIVDPQDLLQLYALPNDTRIASDACPTGAADPLILWVHTGGIVQAIYAPVNGCGFARGEIVDAYQTARRQLLVEVDTGAPLDAHDTPAEH
jgi:hypothetical protein